MRELLAALAPANEQTISDRDQRYITSFVDSLDIALLSSDKDRPHCCAAGLDNAEVFLLDSNRHFPWARSGMHLG